MMMLRDIRLMYMFNITLPYHFQDDKGIIRYYYLKECYPNVYNVLEEYHK